MTRNPDEDRLLDHNYDGIQEYDNPMPGWWVYIFYATIVFAALYFFNVPGIGTGKGRIANYEREVAAWKAQQDELAAKQPKFEVTDASLLAMSRDPGTLAGGKAAFTTNCVPCHRADGGGMIGPNLTDDFWIHGGKPTDIERTIAQGVADKGMPTWSNVLKPEQIAAVAAYVLTLHGTHPANPKEPQGVKVEESSEEHPGAAPESERN
jgi:cytochrome c oxidase cbb3-type subunit III